MPPFALSLNSDCSGAFTGGVRASSDCEVGGTVAFVGGVRCISQCEVGGILSLAETESEATDSEVGNGVFFCNVVATGELSFWKESFVIEMRLVGVRGNSQWELGGIAAASSQSYNLLNSKTKLITKQLKYLYAL